MISRIAWICAALALVGVAAANLLDLARSTPPARIGPPGSQFDPVMRTETRFAGVLAALRQRAISGPIGYFSDFPSARLSAAPHGIERYFQAQFALAPLILEVDGRDPWIVADFEQSASRSRLPAGYRMALDGGDGVLLLQRQP